MWSGSRRQCSPVRRVRPIIAVLLLGGASGPGGSLGREVVVPSAPPPPGLSPRRRAHPVGMRPRGAPRDLLRPPIRAAGGGRAPAGGAGSGGGLRHGVLVALPAERGPPAPPGP